MNNNQKTIGKQALADIKKLHQKKFREETGSFIIEGWKSVTEALQAGVKFKTVLVDGRNDAPEDLLHALSGASDNFAAVSAKEIDAIAGTDTPQGIIAVAGMFDHSGTIDTVMKKERGVVVALDAMNDPGNLGTILRTCDWFDVDAVLIGARSVDLYNPKVVRATMGSLFHLPIIEGADLVREINRFRTGNWKIYSAEIENSEDIGSVTFSGSALVIIGSESHGISKEISAHVDRRIRIPKFGKAESLNAAIACGVILSKITMR
ncbi:MAG: TrmH family RNA methyltransferase [Bacteroidota bacterium]